MARKYFGTDGIRGKANEFPMTAEMALKVAMATAVELRRISKDRSHRSKVVIGKDTRLSGYMIEQAMASGFVSMGMDVVLVGPIPTPAIAMLTRSLRADVGVMISASHNPYQDNGIKLFGYDGFKLDDNIEIAIENRIDEGFDDLLPEPEYLGKANRLDDALGRYVEYVKGSFPRRHTLEGMKIVVDCANGAAYKVAPQVLWELGADVITIGNKPNGRNINDGYGATDTKNLEKEVVEHGADVGIALDGDADRLIIVDEKGCKIDGDQIMAVLATNMRLKGDLVKDTLVSTVMSNMGLEKYLKEQGVKLLRTAVGDRYVVEAMKDEGYSLGGEQSGHIVMLDYGTTGDGLLAALQILAVIKGKNVPASKSLNVFDTVPQILKNIRYSNASPMENSKVKKIIKKVENRLGDEGRILVRESGTEPLIRVMVEGYDNKIVNEAVDEVCSVIEKFA